LPSSGLAAVVPVVSVVAGGSEVVLPSAFITSAGFRCARRSRSLRAASARLWACTDVAIRRITIKALMNPIIHFKCRACEGEVAVSPSRTERVRCPHCSADVAVLMNDAILERNIVTVCSSCGHDALYVQKDFNRTLGMAIVVLGIAASLYSFARGRPFLAMAALGMTAAVDFLAYFLVGEVAVCYSCHAIYRGFNRNPDHEPFDLKKLEKYGGRTSRL
jgi:DNA-directed RNA polymerase subunit RPC12/RpoP